MQWLKRSDPDSGALDLYVVFDHPKDFPGHYVCRRQIVVQGETIDAECVIGSDLEAIRQLLIEMGLIRMDRHPEDDSKILEFWI